MTESLEQDEGPTEAIPTKIPSGRYVMVLGVYSGLDNGSHPITQAFGFDRLSDIPWQLANAGAKFIKILKQADA